MHLLRGEFDCEIDAIGIVTRLLPRGNAAGATQQTLIVSPCGELVPLEGADGHRGMEMGIPLILAEAHGDIEAQREFSAAVWDTYSASLFLIIKNAIFCLDYDDNVALVAGRVQQGPHNHQDGMSDNRGALAGFQDPWYLCSDCEGMIYVADGRRIRCIMLPSEWRATAARTSLLSAMIEKEATVTTLPFEARAVIRGLAHLPGRAGTGSSLVYATATAVYKLPLGGATSSTPALLAGGEGEEGDVDGRALDARFRSIGGLAVDDLGFVFLADGNLVGKSSAIRKFMPGGPVTTIAVNPDAVMCFPSILPNGYLALCDFHSSSLHFLDMDLKSPRNSSVSSSDPPAVTSDLRSLPADFGALLDRQPDGTADVSVAVGDRTFPAHRAILSARCDYFRQRLEGDFADGKERLLSLPDADPDAFALLLRFIYTGAVDVPAALAQALAELADRLLLPELCSCAQARVLAEVRPETVVGAMLWAEAHGHAFSQLLRGLKAWYLGHYEEVVEVAPGSVKRLMEQRSELMLELMMGCIRQAKGARTR